jgi:hypothetical protein
MFEVHDGLRWPTAHSWDAGGVVNLVAVVWVSVSEPLLGLLCLDFGEYLRQQNSESLRSVFQGSASIVGSDGLAVLLSPVQRYRIVVSADCGAALTGACAPFD